VLAASAGALVAAACFSSDPAAPEPDPHVLPGAWARPGAVAVSATEYQVRVARSSLPAGRVQFAFTNDGVEPHELTIVPYRDGRYGTPVADTEFFEPGTGGVLEVTLAPGRYRLVCLLSTVANGTVESHFSRGMSADVQVTGS